MTLHHDKTLFTQAIIATAQRMEIPEIYVEKDYWVTLALQIIFTSEAGQFAIFKGGTALSKCYKLIQRFSEDIDLAAIRNTTDSKTKLTAKLKQISETIEKILPEVEVNGITNKKGMIRKTAHDYPKLGLTGVYVQGSPHIVIESSWLGTFEPNEPHTICSYITETMDKVGQQELITRFNMQPFTVQVLSIKRTFCEKIMSLVRFSYEANPHTELGRKIRHIYDLHKLLQVAEIAIFFDSNEFAEMLNTVGGDDIQSYRNNNGWLQKHPAEAIIFRDPDETWAAIRQEYTGRFKDFVYGELPNETLVLNSLKTISRRLSTVTWLHLIRPNTDEDRLRKPSE
ncbi:nucleotidyl transferase AbiEii/AbiGii toxin family protein [Filimonas effusa]|uniref:Nucleotidyl transferase AbiEii/AbiGii toxin family protein n=1 Tax=Filimonas effusa TaxID=2508721 RepID=A0A4Q1DCU6_9BACT|nr:nucleotidyl transferase AbiEii/AbiGii toxin family protein [Filimonas effusa]RXK87292.1 nucleotidyl transferase AbiEii/AbiGii toxin family protein [Filimonas effusa]